MTKQLQTLAFVFVFALALASTATVRAQDKDKLAPPATTAAPAALVPLKVKITIARYQGEKLISNVPYTLSANTGGARYKATLRMGAQVPITTSSVPVADGKQTPTFQYKDVGTNIDCQATATEGGRFLLELTIEDSSVYPEEQAPPQTQKGNPSFRSFRSSETVIMRDGQSTQFIAATDKLTGETVKVDVTLTVVK